MSCPHQPNRMRRPRRLSPEVAIRKEDRLSVTACCEAPRARLAFEVRKRVDPHSEHARDASAREANRGLGHEPRTIGVGAIRSERSMR